MKIVITGATGFIGIPLVRALQTRGDSVTALVRNLDRARRKVPDGTHLVEADLESPGAWTSSLAGADAVIHLAGEPIADKRWDARRKQQLRDSRIESTRTIVEAIAKLPAEQRPRVLVCASGADYYPYAAGPAEFDDDEVTEADPPSETFLGRLCRDWEKEAHAAESLGLRVVCMRTGLVLGPGGGALDKMKKPFELFAGGKLGDGRQWMSWISLADAVSAYVAAVHTPSWHGAINLVTDSVRNGDFSKALGRATHRPSWLPVPGFAIKAAVGAELAEVLLNGRRVVPAQLKALGFAFQHPTLDAALRAAL